MTIAGLEEVERLGGQRDLVLLAQLCLRRCDKRKSFWRRNPDLASEMVATRVAMREFTNAVFRRSRG